MAPEPAPRPAPAPAPEAGCPRCAAHLRPGAPWCTQCFLDLRAAPAPDPVTAATPAPALEPYDAYWPCDACGTRTALQDVACAGCGRPFLGALQSEQPVVALPVVGDLTRMSGAQRIGLALAVVVAVMLLTAVLGVLP